MGRWPDRRRCMRFRTCARAAPDHRPFHTLERRAPRCDRDAPPDPREHPSWTVRTPARPGAGPRARHISRSSRPHPPRISEIGGCGCCCDLDRGHLGCSPGADSPPRDPDLLRERRRRTSPPARRGRPPDSVLPRCVDAVASHCLLPFQNRRGIGNRGSGKWPCGLLHRRPDPQDVRVDRTGRRPVRDATVEVRTLGAVAERWDAGCDGRPDGRRGDGHRLHQLAPR